VGVIVAGGWFAVDALRNVDLAAVELPKIGNTDQPTDGTDKAGGRKDRNISDWLIALEQDSAGDEPDIAGWQKGASEVSLDSDALPELFSSLAAPGKGADFAKTVLNRYDSNQLHAGRMHLVQVLNHESIEVRRTALALLSKLGPNGADTVPAIAEVLANQTDETERAAAVDCLKNVSGVEPTAALGKLLEDANGTLEKLRLLQALAVVDPASTVSRIAGILETETEVNIRLKAFDVLGKCNGNAIPLLRQLLVSKKPNDRHFSLRTCAVLGPAAEPLLPELRQIFTNPPELFSAGVDRMAAGDALTAIGPSAAPIFREALRSPSGDLRRPALKYFGRHPDPQSIDAIIALLGDEGWAENAMIALGRVVEQVPEAQLPELASAVSHFLGSRTSSDGRAAPDLGAVFVLGAIVERLPALVLPSDRSVLVIRSRSMYLSNTAARIPELTELREREYEGPANPDAKQLNRHFQALKWSGALAKGDAQLTSEWNAARNDFLRLKQKLEKHPLAKPFQIRLAGFDRSNSSPGRFNRFDPATQPPSQASGTTNFMDINTQGNTTIITLGPGAVSEAVIRTLAEDLRSTLAQLDALLNAGGT
jgi:HEAT repeat protein